MKKTLNTFLALFFTLSAFAQPGSNDPTFNTIDDGTYGNGTGFNGAVNAISIQADGQIVVGGEFGSFNGVAASCLARLNPDGSLDNSFNIGTGFNSSVLSTSIQSDGKIIVGGFFTSFNGTSINRIARLNSDGSLDNSFTPGIGFSPGFNDGVYAISIQSDGKIIVGGFFTSFNGTSTNRIARLNSDGSLDNTFNAGTGFNNTVRSISIQSDGKIIVGGYFTSFNGISTNRIARLNTDGSLDNTFNAGIGFNNDVLTTSIQSDGKIIVGGSFNDFNGTERNHIARLIANGNIDPTFDPGTGFSLGSMDIFINCSSIQDDGKIVVGGQFESFNGVSINRIARLNVDGSQDVSFNPGSGFPNEFTVGAFPAVRSLGIRADGKIMVGGGFTSFNGITSVKRLAHLNTDGSLVESFHPSLGFDEWVRASAIQTDGKIIVGGDFTSFNGVGINRIVRLNTDGSLDTTFNPGLGFNNQVYCISIQADGKIIVGGSFSSFNGVASSRLARLNTDGSLDNSFNIGTGFNGDVWSTAIQADGKIIVAGNFTFSSANRIARLNSDGIPDFSFNTGTGFNNIVRTVSIQSDGKIIAGGDFSDFNGTGRNNIARLNANGSIDATFNPGTGFSSAGGLRVWCTSIQSNGKIIVGGLFTSFNGTSINRIACLNSNGSLDGSFNVGSGFNSNVWTTSIQSDGKIIVGGDFSNFNGTGRNCIARLNANGSIDSTFDPGTGFSSTGGGAIRVWCTSIQSNGKIIVGGLFNQFDGFWRKNIARILNCLQTDLPINVSLCDESYTLPALTVGNYYTASNGGGIMLNAGDLITTTQTIFVYEDFGTCSDENSFVVTINTSPLVDAPGNVTSCDSYALPNLNNGNYYTASNGGGTMLNAGDLVTSTQTLYVYASSGSCSSENSFVVTINTTPSVDAPGNVTSCDSYALPNLNNGNYYTANNGGGTMLNAGDLVTSTQTLYVYASSGSCSSENSFVVTINQLPDNSISIEDNTITALQTGATYQWLDCDNGNDPISGETAQSFTPTANGNYAVEVTTNGCIATSSCVEITTVGISENFIMQSISLHPNPTNGEIILQMNEYKNSDVLVLVRNSIGQEIIKKNYPSSNSINLYIEGTAGIYFLEIRSGDYIAVLKVIKN